MAEEEEEVESAEAEVVPQVEVEVEVEVEEVCEVFGMEDPEFLSVSPGIVVTGSLSRSMVRHCQDKKRERKEK